MFYKPETVRAVVGLYDKEKARVVLLTTLFEDPNSLRWGRIIRNERGEVTRIVEQKDASEEERQVKEVNPGFYCFDFNFLRENKDRLQKSAVSGEYYLTDFVKMAVDQGLKVVPHLVPFAEVGMGVNTREDLVADEKFKRQEVE
jgi:bifunctional UDP-N-acetylglucosamine pyrophosphorylase/glucosamine-1-phosphate N-acetyltransferase